MSDPVSNAEIEDVLASIRRLVSEDRRNPPPLAQDADDSVAPAASADGPKRGWGKLILTPALRVENVEKEKAASEDIGTASEATRLRAPWADPTATLHAMREATPPDEDIAEASAEASAGTDEEPPGVVSLQDMTTQAEEAPAALPAETAREPGAESEFVSDSDSPAEVAVDDDLALSEAHRRVDEILGTEEPDVVTGAVVGAVLDRMFETSQESDPAEERARQDDSAIDRPDAPGQSIAVALSGEDAARLSPDAPVREESPAPSQGRDEEPRAEIPAEQEAGVHSPFARTDDVFQAAEEMAGDRALPTAAPAEDAALMDVMDEAALRALVVQIVREELQGELGARITRNVRKLVRQEIHRALATQDIG